MEAVQSSIPRNQTAEELVSIFQSAMHIFKYGIATKSSRAEQWPGPGWKWWSHGHPLCREIQCCGLSLGNGHQCRDCSALHKENVPCKGTGLHPCLLNPQLQITFYTSSQYCFKSTEVIYLHIRFLAFFVLKIFLSTFVYWMTDIPGDVVNIRRQLSGRQSSPSTMWVPGTEFRLSGFVTGAFKQLTISRALWCLL